MARRNFVRHQSTLPLRARTADAILRLMGGRKQASVSHDADSPAAVPVPEGAFAEEERYMINGVLTLAQRPGVGMTLFAFDAGEAISTHAAPGDAMATILEGTAQITIDGVPHTLNAGEAVIMPAGIPHAVQAVTPFKMYLVVAKQ